MMCMIYIFPSDLSLPPSDLLLGVSSDKCQYKPPFRSIFEKTFVFVGIQAIVIVVLTSLARL